MPKKISKRVGSLIKVRPEYEERYIILHKYIFPGVLNRIKISNIRNYSIFLLDGMLFSYLEYIGVDYDADLKAIANLTMQDWWKLTDPMQEPLSTRKGGEWWASTEQILCLEKTLRPSPLAQRIGAVAEITPGKEEEIRNYCKTFGDDLYEIALNENIQNVNLYYKDGKIYLYCEYTGNNLKTNLDTLSRNPKFADWQFKFYKFVVPKDNGYWQEMKEVFHTD